VITDNLGTLGPDDFTLYLDNNPLTEIAVGAIGDDDGGANRGAIYGLGITGNLQVTSEQKISDTQGNFGGILDNSDEFGGAVANIGDLDGDGITDLAVGAAVFGPGASLFGDDDGGPNRGAVYILFMNLDGTVRSEQKISDTAGLLSGIGNPGGTLADGDLFGSSISGIGDLDGDGVIDLAVGADFDDDGGTDRGAVYILFMNADGTVKSQQKISDTAGGFLEPLVNGDSFGRSVTSLGDLDGAGPSVLALAVGAFFDDTLGNARGAVYILFMNTDGTVSSVRVPFSAVDVPL